MKRLLKTVIGRGSISLASTFPSLRPILQPAGLRTAQDFFGPRTVGIQLHGRNFIRLTNIDEHYLAFQLFWRGGEYYEPITRALLSRLVRPGDLFLDIGAHLGFFSLAVGCSVPGVEVIAFEPNPKNFRSLRANLRINGLLQAVCEPVALSERDGVATLYLTESDMSASLVKDFQSQDTRQIAQIEVPTRALDSYLGNREPTQRMVIKVDIEGHEIAFFRGASKTLESSRPDIILEVLSDQDPQLVSQLKSLGYHFYPITDQGLMESDSPTLVKRYPFLFLNHLLSVRPRDELHPLFDAVRGDIRTIDLMKTSKHFPKQEWPALWENEPADRNATENLGMPNSARLDR